MACYQDILFSVLFPVLPAAGGTAAAETSAAAEAAKAASATAKASATKATAAEAATHWEREKASRITPSAAACKDFIIVVMPVAAATVFEKETQYENYKKGNENDFKETNAAAFGVFFYYGFVFALYCFHQCAGTAVYALVPTSLFEVGSHHIINDLPGH